MASTFSDNAKHGSHSYLVRTAYPAGFFSRFEALVIDLVILNVIQIGVSVLIRAFLHFFRFDPYISKLQTLMANSTIDIAVGASLSTLFVIGYFSFFWSLTGYTPGKAVLGLKIVRKDGSKVSFGRSILRFFAYWISAIPLFLGFLWVLWDPNRRSWHDMIADTQVLYIPRLPHK